MESLLQAVVALLAIADPLGAIPFFLGLTEGMSNEERRRAALRAAVAVFAILIVAGIGGRWILGMFGISIAAFRAAGGLIIVLMGLEMLGGHRTRVQPESEDDSERDDAILVPLAMPLIAGPGAIATVMTLAARSKTWFGRVDVLVAVAVTALATYAALASAVWLNGVLGERGRRAFLRFMGLLLVAVGVQLMMSGTREFYLG